MKTTASFILELLPDQPEGGIHGARIHTTNEGLFDAILSLGHKNSWKRPSFGNPAKMTGAIEVFEQKDSQRLKDMLYLIENELNITPIALNWMPKLNPRHFTIHYHRTYTKTDLDRAELLRISPKDIIMATILRVDKDEVFVVKADHNQKNKRSFGCLGATPAFGVAEPLKSILDRENLKGLVFEPIRIEPKEKAIKPLWKISSQLKLPPCQLPVVIDHETTEKYGFQAVGFELGGVAPLELVYRRADLDLLAEFDVAVTSEILSGFEPMREVVVTQRFRKICSDLKVPGMDYVPVRIID